MASGPVIPSINDGDALLGSVIREALSNIKNFISSIPVENLERYKSRMELVFTNGEAFPAGGGSVQTRYYGYQKLQLGAESNSASTAYSMNVFIRLPAAADANDDYTLSIQEASTVNGTYTDVSGCSHFIDGSNTGTYTRVESNASEQFGYYAQLAPTTAIDAGKFLRMKVVNVSTARAIQNINVTLGVQTQLQ